MLLFGRKKQINLQKGAKTGLLKKSQLPRRRFPLFKIGLAVGAILLVLFWGSNKFLGVQQDRVKSNAQDIQLQGKVDSVSGNTILPPDTAISQSPLESPNSSGTVTSSNGSDDLFIGPVRLSDSSYIKEQLDAFAVREQGSQTSSDSTSSTQQHFSLQDIVTKPFDYLASLGYSIRASVMNNGKRTTLLKLIDSVSRYYVSYTRFPVSSPNAEDQYDWITEMVEANEMSGAYEYVLRTTAPIAYCGTVQQSGYCYKSDDTNAILYVRIEESAGKDICGDQALFLLWSSQDNKMGELCMDEEPTALSGFQFLPISSN